ncbi:MAG: hypothetical protein ACXVF0_01985 [Blastococcus sp.]
MAGCGGKRVAPAAREVAMAACEVCGNDYRLSFEVHTVGAVHTFDSFECAIHALAPVCEHCGSKIVGHGVEADGTFFCCASCARAAGAASARELADSAGRAPGQS